MNRPRKTDRHLPPCVYFKHGRFWYVKKGKWHDIGTDLGDALAEYAKRISAPKGGMAELIEKVYAHHAPKVAESTREQYRIAADALKKHLREFAPEQVKGKHVAQIKLAGAGTPNMTNRKLSFLRTVFNYAVEWQLVDSNPCVGVKRNVEQKRKRYITDAEWSAIYDKAGPRLRAIMRLQYLTGQRIGDVLSIRRSQITDAGIEFRQQKTDAKLTVKWSPDLRAAVAEALALHHCVPGLTLFLGRGGKAPDYRTVLLQWSEAAKAAGVEDAKPNDQRAKAATDAKRQGKNATELLGHTSPAMTERYLRDRESPEVDGPSFGHVKKSIRQ